MKALVLFILVSLSIAIPIHPVSSGLSSPQQQEPLLEHAISTSNPDRGSQIEHGMFIEKNLSKVNSNPNYTLALKTEQTFYRLLERYSGELYSWGLLLLVPIALGIVELADRISRSLSVEQFPERGREIRRLESPKEREQWVLRRKEREIRLERSRSWWKWSRH